jgi:hypothetical protein
MALLVTEINSVPADKISLTADLTEAPQNVQTLAVENQLFSAPTDATIAVGTLPAPSTLPASLPLCSGPHAPALLEPSGNGGNVSEINIREMIASEELVQPNLPTLAISVSAHIVETSKCSICDS